MCRGEATRLELRLLVGVGESEEGSGKMSFCCKFFGETRTRDLSIAGWKPRFLDDLFFFYFWIRNSPGLFDDTGISNVVHHRWLPRTDHCRTGWFLAQIPISVSQVSNCTITKQGDTLQKLSKIQILKLKPKAPKIRAGQTELGGTPPV